jgi:hypothetical protein
MRKKEKKIYKTKRRLAEGVEYINKSTLNSKQYTAEYITHQQYVSIYSTTFRPNWP